MRLFLFFARQGAIRAVGAFLVLTLGGGARALGQEGGAEGAPPLPEIGLARIEAAWQGVREPVVTGKAPEAVKSGLEELRRIQWELGILDLPLYSAALLQAAADLSRGGRERASAGGLVEWSRRLAPHRAELNLARARYSLRPGNWSAAEAGREYLDFFQTGREDFAWGLRFLAQALWAVLWAGWILFWILTAVLAARYLRVFLHDFHHLFQEGFLPIGMITALGVVLPLIPLLFGAPLWLCLCAWLLLLGMYFQTGERIAAVGLLLCLGAMPWVLRAYAQILAAPADPVLAAVAHIREGVYSEAELRNLENSGPGDSGSLEVLLAWASVHQRQGKYAEAGQDYQSLLAHPRAKTSPYSEVIYNNLGNLWVAAGDSRQALAAYQAAAKADPVPAETAYNLGQLYHDLLDIEKGDEWSGRASRINSGAADEWSEISEGLPLAQRMAAMPLPMELLWSRAFLPTTRSLAVQAAAWREWSGGIPAPAFSILCWATALILGSFFSLGRRLQVSRPCASCGQPVCPRCHRLSKEPRLCSPCYHVLRSQSGMDPRVRQERKAMARRHQEIWRTAGLAASALAPGSGHLLQGEPGLGLALLLPASFWMAAVVAPAGVWRPEVPVLAEGLPVGLIAAGISYLVIVSAALVAYAARYRG